MTSLALLVALSAIGVDFGYEPAPDGHLEYILQISPQLVEPLAKGQDLTSEVPRDLDVRHFRVTIGTAKLPRQNIRPAAERNVRNRPAADGQPPAGEETSAVRVGYQQLAGQGGEYVIELNPVVLDDLHQHDVTGALPAGVPITRFRVSTQPGRAPAAGLPPAHETERITEPENWSLPSAAKLAADPPSTAADAATEPPSDRPSDSATATAAPRLDPVAQGTTDRRTATWPAENSEANPAAASGEQALAPQDNRPSNPSHLVPVPAHLPADAQSSELNEARKPGEQWANFNDPPASGGQPPLVDVRPPVENPRPDPARNDSPQRQPASRDEPFPTRQPADESEPFPMRAARPATASGHPSRERPGSAESNRQHSSSGSTAGGQSGHSEHAGAAKQHATSTEATPWLPLTLSLLVLCLSIGGNVYLAWVAWDARNRCRMLLEKFHLGELSTAGEAKA